MSSGSKRNSPQPKPENGFDWYYSCFFYIYVIITFSLLIATYITSATLTECTENTDCMGYDAGSTCVNNNCRCYANGRGVWKCDHNTSFFNQMPVLNFITLLAFLGLLVYASYHFAFTSNTELIEQRLEKLENEKKS
jgi:hypothetical protein